MIPYQDYKYKSTLIPINLITDYFKSLNLNTDDFITTEIGAFGGYTSYRMLHYITPKEHYINDTYEFYDKWNHLKNFGTWNRSGGNLTNKDFDDVYKYTKNIFSEYNNVKVVKGYAQDFLNEFPDNYFDFIFSGINVEPNLLTNIMKIVYDKTKIGGYIGGYPLITSPTYHKTVKTLLKYPNVKRISKIKNNIFLLKKV